MPPRKEHGPDQTPAQSVLEAVASGDSVHQACQKHGIAQATVWSWIDAGKAGEPPMYRASKTDHPTRMSAGLWKACVRYAEHMEEAKALQKKAIAQEMLTTIRTAGMKGFAKAKVTRKLVGGVVVEEKHESEQSAPVWQAAAWYLERTLPDEYSQRSEVRVSGDLHLQPGEADLVAAACSDEEAKAIDRGDAKVLAQVVARVRAQKPA